MNVAIEDFSINKLGVVVMDELHMIDDESRGYILEIMATKLLTLQIEENVQLIGMSATLNVCQFHCSCGHGYNDISRMQTC